MSEVFVDNLVGMRYISQDTLSPSYFGNGFSSKAEAEAWRDRACGIACVSMILSAKLQSTPPLGNLIKEGIERRAYVPEIGWSHYGLASMLAERGVEAEVKALSGVGALIELLSLGKSAILSVAPGLTPAISDGNIKKSGHLILVHGLVLKERSPTHCIFSDPDYEQGPGNFSFRREIHDVTSFCSFRGIVI
ncbi:hypothetical protein [Burkholderia pyrrocinia]|uniref:hypothetical protein n=1 Tax=Burkholderia pyrrocinia TaxID=60550 RepID=UPI00064BF271|nr:hypothetical protein [Burkholderia pyrrocinia]AKM02689.1 hypothetical protein ABD05_21035 [Burkholderia pyrrocinia]